MKYEIPPELVVTRRPFEQRIVCPACNSELVHPWQVEVDAGGTVTSVMRDGTHVFQRTPQNVRGVVITQKFFCESGHSFEVEWLFHKGVTFVHVRDRDRVVEWPDAGGPTTIWRD